MITYISGDLFEAVDPKEKPILAHSCNCLGSWGGGIALQFKKRYPHAFKEYESHCLTHLPKDLLGTCLILQEKDCRIACLFTSIDGGGDIVKWTSCSIKNLQNQVETQSLNSTIYMPKINSGIFGVPWDETEAVLTPMDLQIIVYH